MAPKTLEVRLNAGGTRLLTGDQIFLNVGTHAAIPDIPGLSEARPLTHIGALELDYVPEHMIVLGGGYTGLEMAQAYRRFGSRVTIVEQGSQFSAREDADVAEALQHILADEGIEILVSTQILEVQGQSGSKVTLTARTPTGDRKLEGSDILVAVGRVPNTEGIGLGEGRRLS